MQGAPAFPLGLSLLGAFPSFADEAPSGSSTTLAVQTGHAPVNGHVELLVPMIESFLDAETAKQ
jgi:hypothetical protein